MPVFLKYLAVMVAHLIWQHIGGKGPVPPVRIPKKSPVNLPALSPWQVMIAMWLVKKVWGHYGKKVGGKMQDRVKDRLLHAQHPAAKRIGSWIPTSSPLPADTSAPAMKAGNPAPASFPTP